MAKLPCGRTESIHNEGSKCQIAGLGHPLRTVVCWPESWRLAGVTDERQR